MSGQGESVLAATAPPRWRTPANALTLARGLIAPCLAAAIATGRPVVATLLFWIAVATDFGDGWLARRRGETSPFGGLLDHAVDATLCVLGLAALAAQGVVPWPLPLLVAAAFLQYVLDSSSHRGRPLVASQLGRWNGIAYWVLVATPIMRDTLGWSFPSATLVWILGVALCVSTVASMLDRLASRRG